LGGRTPGPASAPAKIIFSHCQDALLALPYYAVFASSHYVRFAASFLSLFLVLMFAALLTLLSHISLGAVFRTIILTMLSAAIAPLFKNRAPRILAHKKIKSLKTLYF
jgi:hypothetical protein